MRKIWLAILVLYFVVIGFYKMQQQEDKILEQNRPINTVQNNVGKFNNKYNYKDLDPLILSYIKKFRNGQLVKNISPSKKLFLYYDFKVVNCPYRRYFQRLMSKYKKDERWTNKYEIRGLEYPTERVSFSAIVGSTELKEFEAYSRACGESFCIIDLQKNKIFVPQRGSIYTSQKAAYKYVYDVMNNLYNR